MINFGILNVMTVGEKHGIKCVFSWEGEGMSKRHILKSRATGKRRGEMNYRKSHYMMLNLGFQGAKEIEDDIVKVLKKHFDIVDLSETSNKKKRGCVGRAFAYSQNTRDTKTDTFK